MYTICGVSDSRARLDKIAILIIEVIYSGSTAHTVEKLQKIDILKNGSVEKKQVTICVGRISTIKRTFEERYLYLQTA